MSEVRDRLQAEFGNIDIYVFDQLLKGRIGPGMRILDAGCGGGRNVHYLLRSGFEVWGVDASAEAVASVRRLASTLAPDTPADRFDIQVLEEMSFADGAFDAVICNAVLHFARDEKHWWAMTRALWRVLAPGGVLFTRLASTIGHESGIKPLANRRYVMPDGHERFLVDEDYLMAATSELGGRLLDPIKTTVVQATRSMTTWVVGK
jgi:tellurite methyltransferase